MVVTATELVALVGLPALVARVVLLTAHRMLVAPDLRLAALPVMVVADLTIILRVLEVTG